MRDNDMRIWVNGTVMELPDGATISDLLEDLDIRGRRVAVEVNQVVIPKSRHPQHDLKPEDQVEIVHAIGGG